MAKIKLVVVNENILGYIQPETPNSLGVLHASILKGAYRGLGLLNTPIAIYKSDKIRLASAKDFEEFNCCFEGYDNPNEYEYEPINKSNEEKTS